LDDKPALCPSADELGSFDAMHRALSLEDLESKDDNSSENAEFMLFGRIENPWVLRVSDFSENDTENGRCESFRTNPPKRACVPCNIDGPMKALIVAVHTPNNCAKQKTMRFIFTP
jgi:hypothetical protein